MMKDKQEQIEEMAPHMCFTCEMNTGFCECIQHGDELCGMAYEAADRLYSEGYRKASDVIDEFVERLRKRFEQTETIANSLHGRKNSEIDSIIKIIAEEMRKENEE